MRWRFADRIDAFHPWVSLQGRKGISLEEYSLLERFDRPGVLPESLTFETCVHFSRWLVERSSEYTQSGLITRVEDFVFHSPARMGDNLQVQVSLDDREKDRVSTRCRVESEGRLLAEGQLELNLIPLETLHDPEARKILWQELYETP